MLLENDFLMGFGPISEECLMNDAVCSLEDDWFSDNLSEVRSRIVVLKLLVSV